MICVDMMARFVPSFTPCANFTPEEKKAASVRGTIVYVNYAHKYFTVEWEQDGVKYLESFNFVDCGKKVHVRG